MSIAEPEANSEIFTEFLDDYFEECHEHLTIIRRNLLSLERFVGQSSIDRSLIDELFRSFHSIKGISGMVGLREAEQLAHQMESCLRDLRNNHRVLTPENTGALISGTRLLEQIIAERRAGISVSDVSGMIQHLEQFISEPDSIESSPPRGIDTQEPAEQVDEQLASRIKLAKTWRIEFAPTPSLAARGINVNVVRTRLKEIGELVHAAPRVTSEGGIVFEFHVNTDAGPALFASWSEDGLIAAIHETAPTGQIKSEDELVTKAQPESSLRAVSNTVRVDLGRLDDLMRMVGDLVISRSRLGDQVKHLEPALSPPQWRPLLETNLAMERQLRDLREGVMRVRMVPIGEIFDRMQFVVRDLAREYQKKVSLELSGQNTEIDKYVVERMMDPILHLVRNAVSHGLETAAERAALGKPAVGRIALRAWTAAEMVVIEIQDDGRGIDAEAVALRARSMGLIGPDAELDNASLLDLICAPGFSTRSEADRASGRGVGMNVVNNTILGLGGTIELETRSGQGTTFTIQLPLTLAIADALIVGVGDHRFAVPQASVREIVEVAASDVKILENNHLISYRGGVLPLLRLARLFRLRDNERNTFYVFVIGSGANSVGVAVDRVLGQREVVVRAITDPLIQVDGIGGATELGDGRVVLILDAAALSHFARKTATDIKKSAIQKS